MSPRTPAIAAAARDGSCATFHSLSGPRAHRVENKSAVVIRFFRSLLDQGTLPYAGLQQRGRQATPATSTWAAGSGRPGPGAPRSPRAAEATLGSGLPFESEKAAAVDARHL